MLELHGLGAFTLVALEVAGMSRDRRGGYTPQSSQQLELVKCEQLGYGAPTLMCCSSEKIRKVIFWDILGTPLAYMIPESVIHDTQFSLFGSSNFG